jgi:hypothetical protein
MRASSRRVAPRLAAGAEPEGSVDAEPPARSLSPRAPGNGLRRDGSSGARVSTAAPPRRGFVCPVTTEPLARTSSSATRRAVEIRRLGAPLAAPDRCRCHTTSPITSSRQCEAEGDPAPGRAARGGLALVVAGGITSGTVVVSAVVVYQSSSPTSPRRCGQCRCGPCRSGPRQPGLGAERAKSLLRRPRARSPRSPSGQAQARPARACQAFRRSVPHGELDPGLGPVHHPDWMNPPGPEVVAIRPWRGVVKRVTERKAL